MLVDSHCHLDRIDLSPYDGDLGAALSAARERGVGQMLCIGVDRDSVGKVLDIASRYPDIWASVGIHPLDLEQGHPASVDELLSWAEEERVVALGETGLDYHYSSDSAAAQCESFRTHLRAAKLAGKPVVVHTRDAREDTLALLRAEADRDVGGVLHCFTESWEMASAALDLGFYISFSGIVTFKNAAELREVVKRVPLQRLLVETDSPYLAPVPYRGKKNEPKYVPEVAACVAELKEMTPAALAQATTANFERLFLGRD